MASPEILSRIGGPLLLTALLWLAPATMRAQAVPATAPDIIGRLSGDAMTVTGATDLSTANGRSAATLSNGSDVTLPFGQARIDLADGGEIELCAPAHLKLLKSGNALTLALDYGRIHVQVGPQVLLTVYTPLIMATPIAIGIGPRDFTIGLDQKDEMCALVESGATRLQQQFSGQSILLPQGGELSLTGGQLNVAQFGSQGCHCEAPVTHSIFPRQQLDLRAPLRPPGPATQPPAIPAPTGPDEAANLGYQMRVDMPPLSFGASSPEPPPGADPETMILVHEVRVQPDVTYQGTVTTTAQSDTASTRTSARSKSSKRGFWARLFGK